MKLRTVIPLSILFLIPSVAFAVTTLQEILTTVGGLINQATPIVAGLALLAFFWGLAMYLFGVGTDSGAASHSMFGAPATASKRDGRSLMIMGIFSLFVIVSVWGLVNVLQVTFGLDGTTTIQAPCINNPYGAPSNCP